MLIPAKIIVDLALVLVTSILASILISYVSKKQESWVNLLGPMLIGLAASFGINTELGIPFPLTFMLSCLSGLGGWIIFLMLFKHGTVWR